MRTLDISKIRLVLVHVAAQKHKSQTFQCCATRFVFLVARREYAGALGNGGLG